MVGLTQAGLGTFPCRNEVTGAPFLCPAYGLPARTTWRGPCVEYAPAQSASAWEDDREAEVVGYADRRATARDHGSVWMLDR
jgi:hypothetical protein